MIRTHVDLLEASYDRAIPPAALAAAKARDGAGEPLPGLGAWPLVVAPVKRRFRDDNHADAIMARLMAERASVEGACGESDLAVAGFSAAEIAKFAPRARARAACLLADVERRAR